MSKIISASIDLNKIDQSKIKQGKNGAKYYNITIMCNDTQDKFGNDVSIVDSQSQQEREAKKPKNYLGNGKTVYDNHATHKPNDPLPF